MDIGIWYARSAEFMQTDTMEILRWLRVIGDTIFFAAAGALALGVFVIGLETGWPLEEREMGVAPVVEKSGEP